MSRVRAAVLRSARCAASALIVALVVLAACGVAPGDPDVDSTPGASLLAALADVRRDSGTVTTQPTPATLQRAADTAPQPLAPEAWVAAEEYGAATSARMLAGVNADAAGRRRATRWEADAPVDLTLPLGRPWLALDGRRLRSHGARADGRHAWRAPWVPLLVWWDPATRRMNAVSEQRPAALELGFERGLGADPRWWADARPAATHALTLHDETRPVLPVGTPGVLAWELAELRSAELELGTALVDLGLSAGDAASSTRFAVDVLADGERERAWSAQLTPGGGFVDARVDLARWKGRACRVELVTESAAGRDAAFAAWTTLRFRDAAHAAPERPHLVLIDLDTLRADGLGCYGNPRDTSPRIDAWAAREALRFSDHVAVNNWTLPSTASLLTGLPVGAHGVLRFPLALDARHRPLALRLAEVGYETHAVTDGGFVVPAHGFAVGFERFEVRRNGRDSFVREGWDAALERARQRDSSRPLFLFLQTYEVHSPFQHDLRYVDAPYDGPLADRDVTHADVRAALAAQGGTLADADRDYLRALYDAGVRRTDDVVGRLLDALPEVFAGEPYAVVITSDHGEELGERGSMGHGTSLHHEQLRVPLLLRPPGGAAEPRVIDAPVSGLDLAPTLLAFAGLPRDPALPGRDLLGDPLADDALRVARHDEHGVTALRLGWKLVDDAAEPPRALGVGLYDHGADPHELNALATHEHPRAASLRELLRAWEARHPLVGAPSRGAAAGDAAHLEALVELGYLGDG